MNAADCSVFPGEKEPLSLFGKFLSKRGVHLKFSCGPGPGCESKLILLLGDCPEKQREVFASQVCTRSDLGLRQHYGETQNELSFRYFSRQSCTMEVLLASANYPPVSFGTFSYWQGSLFLFPFPFRSRAKGALLLLDLAC